MKAGALGLGAALVGAATPLLAADPASALSLQPSWAFCEFCAGLWYYDAANPTLHNTCPSYTNSLVHSATSSFDYEIPYPVTSPGNPQPNWSWCWQCGGLFYSKNQSSSVCPVGVGDPSPVRHNASQSFSYGLNYYSTFPTDNPQPGWYWCNACQGLWVVSSAATNCCPKNGSNGHVIDDGSDTYGLTWNGGISPKVPG